MVHREQQHVLMIRNTDQPAADQGPVFKIESRAYFRSDKVIKFLLSTAVSTQIVLRQREMAVFHRSDPLHQLPIDHTKTSAESFMASHNAVQRSPKCCAIKVALHPDSERNVVRFAGAFHLRQKPQSLLRIRQSQTLTLLTTADGWQFGMCGLLKFSSWIC